MRAVEEPAFLMAQRCLSLQMAYSWGPTGTEGTSSDSGWWLGRRNQEGSPTSWRICRWISSNSN